ncbi:MAG: hypothetical protein OXT67_08600 [Zetaproteobacteria bacterium]|nr:hypothetical protein [Zetaproteobacteria bacterium]
MHRPFNSPWKLRIFLVLGYLTPIVLAGVASSYHGILAGYAAWSMKQELPTQYADVYAARTAQSIVQRHFASFGIHIPFDDIWVTQNTLEYQRDLANALAKSCGFSQIYIWIPITVRFPFWGQRVFEWCWIPPQSKKANQL